ncbi:hypothetical protein GobsT_69110 [Gemmata obscuriglobus]|uniref:Uncharacterized protein n=1 Tax=Gemmata obscuriglobus TaxID=114 RepID=A0A2Z3HEE2_9BACT|nr:hypothetical protein [Gemmata obscuriglobus]AWM41957.1 hypothetical protein C1280_36510 [Gemmata obscuriglobus]QEG32061.1 hypothetical protein GobsT_69110 [Gemmata obscuriglobus]VTS11412.1 unnamed protein product [Gemmata obscuriglobus UQM 2246]
MLARAAVGSITLCAVVLGGLAQEPKQPQEVKFKPTLILTGSHSAIRKNKFEVVANERDWQKLWKEHRGDAAARLFTDADQSFDVDFDTHYVVAVFYGGSPEGRVTPRRRGEALLIGYENLYYQTEGGAVDTSPDLSKAQEATTAHYAFLVLSKPMKTVVIERNTQRVLGEPPIWEEQKRFPAPKDKK